MNSPKHFLNIFIVTFFFIFVIPISAFSYNTKEKGPGGHDGLAAKSLNFKMDKSGNERLKDELIQNNKQKFNAVIDAVSDEDAIISDETFPRWMKHFYNPVTGRGLPYFENAKERAEMFYKSAVNSYCSGNKQKAWDKLGHALHLLQDMGSPSHVRNATHAFQQFKSNWGFENYISNNWATLESQVVAQDCELGGGIGKYIDTMALYTYFGYERYDQERITPYPISLDSICPLLPILLCYTPLPVTKGEDPYPNEPYNTIALLNKVACYSAGLIDSFWNDIQTCSQKPPSPGPGGDTPDDNYEVSTPLKYDIDEAEYQWLNMRFAMKKGRIGYYWAYLYGNKYEEIYNLPPDTPNETIAQKFAELKSIEDLLSNYPYNETDDTKAAPDVAVLYEGFNEGIVRLLFKNQETARLIELQFSPDDLKNQPIFIIPSGGLYGLENSDFFRASLDSYVKNGGTLIVFAQQHGYEFSVLPVPQEADGTFKTITGYGWTEDQSCFTNAAYIENYHQILSGQSRSTPTLNIDGYFTNYPSNATVLLRRTANGQPAMFMYDYGLGKVIITSMYSDFAYSRSQASSEEKALVRDMISWAKAPAQLPEVKPGQTVSVAVSVVNNTTTNASSIKFLIYNPDRTTLLSEQTVSLSVPAGSSSQLITQYASPITAPLGIYHIDYELLDSNGNMIQPQAETDSGRFVVSSPPANPYNLEDF